jgi:hypothetical protein
MHLLKERNNMTDGNIVEEYKGYTIQINNSDSCDIESPLMECNWIKTDSSLLDSIDVLHEMGDRLEYQDADEDEATIDKFEQQNPENMVYPLYKFEHGQVSYSTVPYSCRFDSGQIGWIVFNRKAFGWGRWSAKRREMVQGMLNQSLESYAEWCNGEVYGYDITKDDEEIDSCHGFLGLNSADDAAKELIDSLA